jgi:hypothetical protein
MKNLSRGAALMVAVTLLSGVIATAQTPIKLKKSGGSFQPTAVDETNTTSITLNDQVYIEGYYHSFAGTDPVAVIVKLTDPRATPSTRATS